MDIIVWLIGKLLVWFIPATLFIFFVSWLANIFEGKTREQEEQQKIWKEEQRKLGNHVDTWKSNLYFIAVVIFMIWSFFKLND